jgi:hypothetical protein
MIIGIVSEKAGKPRDGKVHLESSTEDRSDSHREALALQESENGAPVRDEYGAFRSSYLEGG